MSFLLKSVLGSNAPEDEDKEENIAETVKQNFLSVYPPILMGLFLNF